MELAEIIRKEAEQDMKLFKSLSLLTQAHRN